MQSEQPVVIDHDRHRYVGQHLDLLCQYLDRRNHFDVPPQRTREFRRGGKCRRHPGAVDVTHRTVKIETQAAHAAGRIGCEGCFRNRVMVDNRNAATSAAERIKALQQHRIVGAIEAGLHDHKALDPTGHRKCEKLVERSRLRQIGPRRRLRVDVGGTDDVDVAVAAHVHGQ